MIPKSGHRFSDEIMREDRSMIPKSGHRSLGKIMRKELNKNSRGRAWAR
jgi:hypothetical protein